MKHVCPDCRNTFVQPFKCTTCGAQKLYDATLRAAQTEADRMRPVFNAALGVCVTGKATLPQLIKACIKAARKAKGK